MRSDKGFTLIEVIMVIVIVAIISTAILMYFAGLGGSGYGNLPVASNLAEQKIEEILADKSANRFSTIVSEPPAALSAPFDRFTRGVEAYCVQESDLNTNSGTMPECADSDIQAKRVRVTVSWSGGSTELITVITNH